MGKGEGFIKAHVGEELDEAKAMVQAWTLALRFSEMAAVKCAIQLGVADVIESHGGSATLAQLSSALSCSLPLLHRIMRFLVYLKVFKARPGETLEATTYAHTALSRLLVKGSAKSMANLILFEATPTMLAPWHNLSALVSSKDAVPPPFEEAHGKDLWAFSAQNPEHSKLLDEAMACDARLTAAAITTDCPEVFDGVGVMIDVGGGNGSFLGTVVKALPHIKGINFDLPHVVSVAPQWDGVKHVGGNMFESIPKADATFLLKVLHDWSDNDCIRILKKCKEAVSDNDGDGENNNIAVEKRTKKVVIVEAVIEDDFGHEDEENELESWRGVRLSLDMVMMAHTDGGKERTRSEWADVLNGAGFSRFSIKPTSAVQSIIEAFP